MRSALLERRDSSDHGTFGVLTAGSLALYSGELPDRGNKNGISCVLPGTYRWEWTWSPRFGRFMYLMIGAEPRTGIRIHAANLMGDASFGMRSQLNGCLAFGERLGYIDGQKALLLSAPAVRRFEDYMERKAFMLEIRDV